MAAFNLPYSFMIDVNDDDELYLVFGSYGDIVSKLLANVPVKGITKNGDRFMDLAVTDFDEEEGWINVDSTSRLNDWSFKIYSDNSVEDVG